MISVFWVLEQRCYIRLAGSENLKLTQVISNGAGDRNRTYDLRVTSALLYRLSYTGILALNTSCNRCATRL